MKITVTGGKGGTGKSMVATSLAVEFAKKSKTMLVDADAECPNDHLLLSVNLRKHSTVYQPIPKFNLKKCVKCGKCASVCKQNAIAFAEGMYPAFVRDVCIGCKACIVACRNGAISETKKEIGTICTGKNYNVKLVSCELKLGELASGEVVAAVRRASDKIGESERSEVMIIDSAAGIGCPVIASITGTDYVVAVTEPTPSALHDLKRILYLAGHFGIIHGIVINKYDLEGNFCAEIEKFARKEGIAVIGKLPYSKDFIKSAIKMKPVSEINPKYAKTFRKIAETIDYEVNHEKA